MNISRTRLQAWDPHVRHYGGMAGTKLLPATRSALITHCWRVMNLKELTWAERDKWSMSELKSILTHICLKASAWGPCSFSVYTAKWSFIRSGLIFWKKNICLFWASSCLCVGNPVVSYRFLLLLCLYWLFVMICWNSKSKCTMWRCLCFVCEDVLLLWLVECRGNTWRGGITYFFVWNIFFFLKKILRHLNETQSLLNASGAGRPQPVWRVSLRQCGASYPVPVLC